MISRYFGFALLLAGAMLPATAAAQTVMDGALGAPCDAVTDCMAGLTCIQASSKALGGRGPAGGLCTASCSEDSDCAVWAVPGFPVQPACESVGGSLLCLEGCLNGVEDSPPQCHQRGDFACQKSGRPPPPLASETPGECIPLCGFDAQCGARHCNPALGLCQDEAITGDPIGASCDPDASQPTCAGFCDPGAAGEGGDGSSSGGEILPVEVFPVGPPFCSQRCVVDGPIGCGWSGKGTPTASCSAVDSTHGPNDVGLCQQLCNCDADCLASGYVCVPGGEIYGAAGTCKPVSFAQSRHLPDCEAQTDFGACIYGDTRACKGAGNCLGSATCLDDKSGYGKCDCADAGAGGGADVAAGAAGESLAGAESVGGIAASAGGVADVDGAQPNPSGKTPEPGCSCSLVPVRSRFGWLTLALASGLFVHSRLRRRGRHQRRLAL